VLLSHVFGEVELICDRTGLIRDGLIMDREMPGTDWIAGRRCGCHDTRIDDPDQSKSRIMSGPLLVSDARRERAAVAAVAPRSR
jgi:ABC-type multidrug transport system ATPase subunit